MKRPLRTFKLAILMLAFSAKAFVPTGMMLDAASFMHGGNLVTICPSVGRLPWMKVHFDHDSENMDETASKRCPYGALNASVLLTDTIDLVHMQGWQHYEPLLVDSLYRNLIEKRSARAPPNGLSFV